LPAEPAVDRGSAEGEVRRAQPSASPVATLRGREGSTRRRPAGQVGSHQFQRPISEITAGTIRARMIVASIRIPAARPVANIFTLVSGPEAIEVKARNRISAALVTSRPVRPIP